MKRYEAVYRDIWRNLMTSPISNSKKVTTYRYKPIELENYQRNEQGKLDKKLVKAQLTGDYSEIIETVSQDEGTDMVKKSPEATDE
jgi:hypothetical protein